MNVLLRTQTRCALPAGSASVFSAGESPPMWKHQIALFAANAGDPSSAQSLWVILFHVRLTSNSEQNMQTSLQKNQVSSSQQWTKQFYGVIEKNRKGRELSLLEEKENTSTMLASADLVVSHQPRMNLNTRVQNRCRQAGKTLGI